MGVDAYVTKPFEPDELVDDVRSVAGGEGRLTRLDRMGR